tara:strand:- start:3931 stop:4107 length:177 start_codon:yes stop_codon:yes gene_type:complete
MSTQHSDTLSRINDIEEKMQEIEEVLHANSELLEELTKHIIEIRQALSKPQPSFPFPF